MNNKPKYNIGDIVRVLDLNDVPYATAKITSVMLAQDGEYEYYLEPAAPDTPDNITTYAHEEACLSPIETAVAKNCKHTEQSLIRTPKFQVGDNVLITSRSRWQGMSGTIKEFHASNGLYLVEINNTTLYFYEHEIALLVPMETQPALIQTEDKSAESPDDFPQDHEDNEYRYLSPDWLDEIAYGLTKGAIKHPGETWRQIPAREHAWRAIRHLMLYLKGDKEDKHLINASMRVMMAFEKDKAGV